jgi:hypothetical protein
VKATPWPRKPLIEGKKAEGAIGKSPEEPSQPSSLALFPWCEKCLVFTFLHFFGAFHIFSSVRRLQNKLRHGQRRRYSHGDQMINCH